MQLEDLVDLESRLCAHYLDAGDEPLGTAYICNAVNGTIGLDGGARLNGGISP